MMRSLLLPPNVADDSRFGVRLGRILNWLGVGVGIIAMLGALVVGFEDYRSARDSEREIAAWEARQASAPTATTSEEAWPGTVVGRSNDERPYPHTFTLMPAFTVLAFGFLFALAGRALRYLLANE